MTDEVKVLCGNISSFSDGREGRFFAESPVVWAPDA